MNRTAFAPALLCLLILGCDNEPTPDPAAAPTVDQPADGADAAGGAETANRSKDLVLAEGYTPSFEHRLRSQRHEPKGTQFEHVVIVEYLNADAEEIVATLDADLTALGFDVADPIDHGGARRLVARSDNGVQLVADVHGSDAVKLNNPAARGIVYFAWTDSNPAK